MIRRFTKIWLDGAIADGASENTSLMTHALHYGVGAFEGIRVYRNSSGKSHAFRLADHIDRLFGSCKLLFIEIPFDRETIARACCETVAASAEPEAYVRPLVFVGDGDMGVYAPQNPVRVAVLGWTWDAPTQGVNALARGIRAKFSSYTRQHVNASLTKAKVTGQYVGSVLAKREAKLGGYDEALLLDANGYVAEASTANVFIVKKGVLYTPDSASSILEGITRDTVMQLAREDGRSVVETRLTRDMVLLADEVFIAGTASELTPVREVDDRKIGDGTAGHFTRRIQERFFAIARGDDTSHPEWLTPIQG